MRKILPAAIAVCLSISPVFAGALLLSIENPNTDPEAAAKHAVVLARVTECKSPEKTVVIATAEGVVAGERRSLPLKLIRLATPGLYAVSRDWPAEGKWAVSVVVTNPDYGRYVTAAVVPIGKPESLQQFHRVPTLADIAASLGQSAGSE
jgi:hypothetical protein